eukprot:3171168-Alexandrium_andersonii.AAC.1
MHARTHARAHECNHESRGCGSALANFIGALAVRRNSAPIKLIGLPACRHNPLPIIFSARRLIGAAQHRYAYLLLGLSAHPCADKLIGASACRRNPAR